VRTLSDRQLLRKYEDQEYGLSSSERERVAVLLRRRYSYQFIQRENEECTAGIKRQLGIIAKMSGFTISWGMKPGRNYDDGYGKKKVFSYEGSQRKIAGSRSASDVIHDVAHYLVCSEERRDVHNFGLGPAPDDFSRTADSPELVKGQAASHEEEMASLLGILIEAHLGVRFTGTLIEHNWDEHEKLLDMLAILQKKGHVHGHIPVICKQAGLARINHIKLTKKAHHDHWSIR